MALPRLEDAQKTYSESMAVPVKHKEEHEFNEFTPMLVGCQLVYKRVDNSKHRNFSKGGRKYYCSVFFDPAFLET